MLTTNYQGSDQVDGVLAPLRCVLAELENPGELITSDDWNICPHCSTAFMQCPDDKERISVILHHFVNHKELMKERVMRSLRVYKRMEWPQLKAERVLVPPHHLQSPDTIFPDSPVSWRDYAKGSGDTLLFKGILHSIFQPLDPPFTTRDINIYRSPSQFGGISLEQLAFELPPLLVLAYEEVDYKFGAVTHRYRSAHRICTILGCPAEADLFRGSVATPLRCRLNHLTRYHPALLKRRCEVALHILGRAWPMKRDEDALTLPRSLPPLSPQPPSHMMGMRDPLLSPGANSIPMPVYEPVSPADPLPGLDSFYPPFWEAV